MTITAKQTPLHRERKTPMIREKFVSRTRLFAWPAILAALAGLSFTACSRDPKPGTPEAAARGEQLMRSMSEALARTKTFTFETNEQLEVIPPGAIPPGAEQGHVPSAEGLPTVLWIKQASSPGHHGTPGA